MTPWECPQWEVLGFSNQDTGWNPIVEIRPPSRPRIGNFQLVGLVALTTEETLKRYTASS